MPVLRIFLGVLVGSLTLALVMVVASSLNINLGLAAIAWAGLVGLLFDLNVARRSRGALAAYWARTCTGALWRRRFPNSSKTTIRLFLGHFVDAFGFPGRQLSFAPDDRILDVYRALYPDRSTPDNLELETLAEALQRNYGIDLATLWRDEITLGDLYARTSP